MVRDQDSSDFHPRNRQCPPSNSSHDPHTVTAGMCSASAAAYELLAQHNADYSHHVQQS